MGKNEIVGFPIAIARRYSESLAQSKPRASIFDLLASTVYIESDKGSGSGVLVNSDAFVITAYHVIDEVKSLKIKPQMAALFLRSGTGYR